MNLIFFTHPSFLVSQSMPRFADMLVGGMKKKGHQVQIWSVTPQFYTDQAPASVRKWLGYIDQYLLFPRDVKRRLRSVDAKTLFVFTDHALGPWVPLVKDKAHVVHCHDFLAQRSALGEIPENPTGWSGTKYQQYIRNGYRQGKNFISVSEKTRADLHRFLVRPPQLSEVVYNGMNRQVNRLGIPEARTILENKTGLPLSAGYILHVGGNQWYKNRTGVIKLYTEWRRLNHDPFPLLLAGAAPSASLQQERDKSDYKDSIHFLTGLDDNTIQAAYTGASLFLYPSLAEGFGWPIAEAMACGCPVITTGEAPMTEVGGSAAVYIGKRPPDEEGTRSWAKEGAITIDRVLSLTAAGKEEMTRAGRENINRFDTQETLSRIEAIYETIVTDFYN